MKGYLSLGSNQGNKAAYLKKALQELSAFPGLKLEKVSGFYETEPWGGVEQDSFLNIAVEIETVLDPIHLLQICQDVESRLGRERVIRWGPRTIDIDILLYGNQKINCDNLIIPHPFLEAREFVLAPLREIAPQLVLPSGKPISEVTGEGKVKKISL
jgi:2-amino-4-hydroxy-6-hydroxymethyldihydropteridine diphosphokinase